MKILGGQFVFGRTIDEALDRAAPERKRGLSHSFDMLGEAARTHEDAERYAEAYRSALARLMRQVLPRLPVISYAEVSRTAQIESLGVVSGAVAIR